MSGGQYVNLGGWLDVPERHVMAAQLPKLRSLAPHLIGSYRDDKPILLYKAFADVLGGVPYYVAQQIGDCVSHGHAHANDLLQCIEIALGEPSEFRQTDTEYIYACSRESAGILGNSDGSFGSAAIQAMTKEFGMVSREMLGSDGEYAGSRAKDWGRRGAPDSAKKMGKSHLLGAAALIKTWDELVGAASNGYPVTISSDQGFTMTRDKNGFCHASGTWNHCMHIIGLRFDSEGACVRQSWGPDTPDGPTDLDQPTDSFWADRRTIERILAQGDSWAISRSPQFVARDIPWRYNSVA